MFENKKMSALFHFSSKNKLFIISKEEWIYFYLHIEDVQFDYIS